jgi:hypothetical protein
MSAYDLINPSMVRLLHSRLHRAMSGRLMTVSYRGRKSGKDYCIPLSYYRDGNSVYCFTNGTWRHNFATAAAATLRIKGEDYPAQGAVFTGDIEQKTDIMTRYFKAVPQDKKFYGVGKDDKGEPARGDVKQATRVVDIIRFDLL